MTFIYWLIYQIKTDGAFYTFNLDHPTDFQVHSLSVGDIVALKQNDVLSCLYVDSWGFKELPGSLKPENYLKNAEMAIEDDYGVIDSIISNGPRKTVAELEEQAKTGTYFFVGADRQYSVQAWRHHR